jgi:hypothetical protein
MCRVYHIQRNVLEGEFSALFIADVSVRQCTMFRGRVGILTARTLSNDVLPAFCRPIIVMSISVALFITIAE